TFHCVQAALPAMLAAGWGRVINVASTAGLIGYPYVTAYCAAKHGVVGLTRALALEVARKGVTVNAVCPGFTDTDIVRGAVDNIVQKTGRTAEAARAELAARNPQGRLVQPAEVAEAVAWLALPASASINGQAIAVDGGAVMPGWWPQGRPAAARPPNTPGSISGGPVPAMRPAPSCGRCPMPARSAPSC